MSKNSVRAVAGFCAVAVAAWACVHAQAHPLSQGRFELVVAPGKVTLWARVTLEQVLVQQALRAGDDGKVNTQADVYRSHAAYMLKHIFLTADGRELTGRMASFAEPDAKAIYVDEVQKQFVTFELEYVFTGQPGELKLRQNVLHEIDYTENNPWESTYITGMRQEGGASVENLLLTSSNTLSFTCQWTAPATTTTVTAATVAAPARPVQDEPPPALQQPLPPRSEIPWMFFGGVGAGVVLAVAAYRQFTRRAKR